MRIIETERKNADLIARENEFKKKSLEAQRKIKQLQIQNEINEQFNPFETDMDQVQIQIQEAEAQGKDIMSRHLTASNQEKNINLARIDMNNALEDTLSRYEISIRPAANQHLMELIGRKT